MLTAIRNWVIRTMMKAKGQTGVVQTLPKRDIVEINTQITAQKLLQNGIDPEALKNADQVENAIIAIESRPKVQEGIKSTSSAKIFDLEGKEIKNPKNIMGGKEINQQTLNEELMKTDNPFSDLVKTTEKGPKTLKEREAEVLATMEKSNKETVQRIKQRKMVEDAIDNMSPSLTGDTKYDATLVAEDLAERMGKVYDDLPQMERLDLYDKAYTGLSAQRYKGFKKPKDADDPNYDAEPADFDPDADNETFAQGGRAGFKEGNGVYNEKALLGKRVRELMDEGYEFGEAVKQAMSEGYATGGRAGFAKGLGFFTSLFGKGGKMFRKRGDVPTSVFSEKKGPMTIKDLENIPEDQLRKIMRTQELGLYTETPEILKAGNLFERFTKKVGGKRVIDYNRAEVILNRKLRGDETLDELLQIEYQTRPGRAEGGIMRLGLKEGSGMTRRTFLKLLGGMAAIPIVGKFLKPMKIGKTVTKVPLIKTDNVPGKPEWFDALVNKVIIEGDNVTKKFATAERQSIHQKTLNDGSVVRVTEDIDDGAVRVEYESVDNMYEDPVQLQYKKPLPDEGDANPAAEFTTAESGPIGRQTGPDDYDIDIDEVGGTSISDLTSDVSKLKEYATGKKQTLKEFVQSKKRKDKAKAISEGGEAEAEEVVRRQGDFEQFGDLPDEADFASGGIARMLGE